MNSDNNAALVNSNCYDPSILYNRIGQYFYRTGEMAKAKTLFLFSVLCKADKRIFDNK